MRVLHHRLNHCLIRAGHEESKVFRLFSTWLALLLAFGQLFHFRLGDYEHSFVVENRREPVSLDQAVNGERIKAKPRRRRLDG
jgi:hypothetical protein